jgi:putative transcriptional regulator
MKDSSALKNELIFQYAAGTSSLAKSLMASTYLFLNSRENFIYNQFENYCGEELKNSIEIQPKNLMAYDCTSEEENIIETKKPQLKSPIYKFINSLDDLKWNKIFSGFYEYTFKISDNEFSKLIKMNPGTKVPLHSHNGKEYILILEGSYSDQHGTYNKGGLQINDSQIKHTPIACKNKGCICLIITEKNLIFFGPFAIILNTLVFIKSLIFRNK